MLAASMPLLKDNLAFHIPKYVLPQVQPELPLYRASRINLVFDEDIGSDKDFLVLNPGEGYGRLQVLDPDDRPHPRDVVLYEVLPNELPRVAGIISTVPQTPLSHVNLRLPACCIAFTLPLRASSTPPSNAPSTMPETMRAWSALTPGSSRCFFSSATSMKLKAMSITSSPCALIRSTQTVERETLVNRSGDTYFFLTSEERDINREIKNVDLSSAEEAGLLGGLVFDDVLKGQRKHRFSVNRMDFSFNRICDAHPVGNRTEGALIVSILTPLADDYESYQDGRCVLESSREDGQVLIRLRDDESLGRELRTLLRTDKYIRTRDDGTLPPTTKRIHRDLADENRIRRERLTHLLGEMMAAASYFVAGQRLEVSASAPQAALGEATEYLIQNTFNKMGYLETLCEDPLKEIQAVLRSNDIGQHNLDRDRPESNPQATEDLRNYIELCTKINRQIVLFDMITARYANRPYGWPELEVILLLARLIMAGEAQCVSGGAAIPKDKLYDALTSKRKWRTITVVQQATARPEDVQKRGSATLRGKARAPIKVTSARLPTAGCGWAGGAAHGLCSDDEGTGR